jgi:hypothetical protein
MAVYQGERYLREAVESILNQTIADFELIIVDDGSTDSTPAILDSYPDARIVRLRNEAPTGANRARNRALAAARGPYLAIQDADDISYSFRFERQLAFLDAHQAVGLLGSAYDLIDSEGLTIDRASPPTDNDTLQHTLVRRNCMCHSTVMIRAHLLNRVGPYCDDMSQSEDYDLYLRLAECTRLANLAEPLCAYRRHTGSISVSAAADQEKQRLVALRRMLGRRRPVEGVPGSEPQDLAATHVVLAVGAARKSDWSTARGHLAQAWNLAPDWLTQGGFAEVVEEGLWAASAWARWPVVFATLERLLTCLPAGARPRGIRQALANLYRHQAFDAHGHGEGRQVRRAVWNYWRRRPLRAFTDRGMASIWLSSWRRGVSA